MRQRHSEAGFNLPELMVAMAIMLLIAGAATQALLKLSTTQATIWNRTQMHSGIRGATEVLQQEVGQAGKVSLPSAVTLTGNVSSGASKNVDVTSTTGMFQGEKLTIDAGCYDTATPCTSRQEVVTVSSITSGTRFVATLVNDHANGAAVQALGGFYHGIVPDNLTNGSTAAVMKLFGDINGDGSMVYIEYSVSPACICSNTCTPTSTTGNLYRNSMAWNAGSKTAASASQILLSNITANPNGTACFDYQKTPSTVGGNYYVLDVAITLTVQTQVIDPVTKSYQKETKALLNVTPRNVFNTWALASLGYTDRVQPTPSTITNLLPGSGS